MKSNKLFFIGLAIVAVLYFAAVGSNARHGGKEQKYETEAQQKSLVSQYKGFGLQGAADKFDLFTEKIDFFTAIDKTPANQGKCLVKKSGDDLAVKLAKNAASCVVLIPKSEEIYRELMLSFNFNAPGIVDRGRVKLRPLEFNRPRLQDFNRRLPQSMVITTAEKLKIKFKVNDEETTEIMNFSKPQKIGVTQAGGILTLSCIACNQKPIYIRSD